MEAMDLQERRRRKAVLAASFLSGTSSGAGSGVRTADGIAAATSMLCARESAIIAKAILSTTAKSPRGPPGSATRAPRRRALQPGSVKATVLEARDIRSWRFQRRALAAFGPDPTQTTAQEPHQQQQPQPFPTAFTPASHPSLCSSGGTVTETAAADQPDLQRMIDNLLAGISAPMAGVGTGGAGPAGGHLPSGYKPPEKLVATPATHRRLLEIATAISQSRASMDGFVCGGMTKARLRHLCRRALSRPNAVLGGCGRLWEEITQAESIRHASTAQIAAADWNSCKDMYDDICRRSAVGRSMWVDTVCEHLCGTANQYGNSLGALPFEWRCFVERGECEAVAAATGGVCALRATCDAQMAAALRASNGLRQELPATSLYNLVPLACAALYGVILLLVDATNVRSRFISFPEIRPHDLYDILLYLEPLPPPLAGSAAVAASSAARGGGCGLGTTVLQTLSYSREHLENVAARYWQDPDRLHFTAVMVRQEERLERAEMKVRQQQQQQKQQQQGQGLAQRLLRQQPQSGSMQDALAAAAAAAAPAAAKDLAISPPPEPTEDERGVADTMVRQLSSAVAAAIGTSKVPVAEAGEVEENEQCSVLGRRRNRLNRINDSGDDDGDDGAASSDSGASTIRVALPRLHGTLYSTHGPHPHGFTVGGGWDTVDSEPGLRFGLGIDLVWDLDSGRGGSDAGGGAGNGGGDGAQSNSPLRQRSAASSGSHGSGSGGGSIVGSLHSCASVRTAAAHRVIQSVRWLVGLEVVDPDLTRAVAAECAPRRAARADSDTDAGGGGGGAATPSAAAAAAAPRRPGLGCELRELAVKSGVSVMNGPSVRNKATATLWNWWLNAPKPGDDGGGSIGDAPVATVPKETTLLVQEFAALERRQVRRMKLLAATFRSALVEDSRLAKLVASVVSRRTEAGAGGDDEERRQEEDEERDGSSGAGSVSSLNSISVGGQDGVGSVAAAGRGGGGSAAAVYEELVLSVDEVVTALTWQRPGLLEAHPESWGKLVELAKQDDVPYSAARQELGLALLGLTLLAHRPDLPLRLLRLLPCVAAGATYRGWVAIGVPPPALRRTKWSRPGRPCPAAHYHALTAFATFSFLPGSFHDGAGATDAAAGSVCDDGGGGDNAPSGAGAGGADGASWATDLARLFKHAPGVWAPIALYISVHVLANKEEMQEPWLFAAPASERASALGDSSVGANSGESEARGLAAVETVSPPQRRKLDVEELLLELKRDIVVAAAEREYGNERSACGADDSMEGGEMYDPEVEPADLPWVYGGDKDDGVFGDPGRETYYSGEAYDFGAAYVSAPGGSNGVGGIGTGGGYRYGTGSLADLFANGTDEDDEPWVQPKVDAAAIVDDVEYDTEFGVETSLPTLTHSDIDFRLQQHWQQLEQQQAQTEPVSFDDHPRAGSVAGLPLDWLNAGRAIRCMDEQQQQQQHSITAQRPASSSSSSVAAPTATGDAAAAANFEGVEGLFNVIKGLGCNAVLQAQYELQGIPGLDSVALSSGDGGGFFGAGRGGEGGGGSVDGLSLLTSARHQDYEKQQQPRFTLPESSRLAAAAAGRLGRLSGGGGEQQKLSRQLGGPQWNPQNALPPLLRVWSCAANRNGPGDGEGGGATGGSTRGVEHVTAVGGPGMMLALTALHLGDSERRKRFLRSSQLPPSGADAAAAAARAGSSSWPALRPPPPAKRVKQSAAEAAAADSPPSSFPLTCFQPTCNERLVQGVLGQEPQAVFPPPEGSPGVAFLCLRSAAVPAVLMEQVVAETDSGGGGAAATATAAGSCGGVRRRSGLVVVSKRSNYAVAAELARSTLISEQRRALRVLATGLEGLETAMLVLSQVRGEMVTRKRDLAVVVRQLDHIGIAASWDGEAEADDAVQVYGLTNGPAGKDEQWQECAAAAAAAAPAAGKNNHHSNRRSNGGGNDRAASASGGSDAAGKLGDGAMKLGGSGGGMEQGDGPLELLAKYDNCLAALKNLLPAVDQDTREMVRRTSTASLVGLGPSLSSSSLSPSPSSSLPGPRPHGSAFFGPSASTAYAEKVGDQSAIKAESAVVQVYDMLTRSAVVRRGLVVEMVAFECELGKPDRPLMITTSESQQPTEQHRRDSNGARAEAVDKPGAKAAKHGGGSCGGGSGAAAPSAASAKAKAAEAAAAKALKAKEKAAERRKRSKEAAEKGSFAVGLGSAPPRTKLEEEALLKAAGRAALSLLIK